MKILFTTTSVVVVVVDDDGDDDKAVREPFARFKSVFDTDLPADRRMISRDHIGRRKKQRKIERERE